MQDMTTADSMFAVVDAMFEGAVTVDVSGIIQQANDAICFRTGFDAADLIGTHVDRLFGPTKRPDMTRLFERFRGERRPRPLGLLQIACVDGSSFIVEGRACPLYEGPQVVGATLLFHDRSANDTLRDQADTAKAQFEALLEATPNPAFLMDRDGRLMISNHAARAITPGGETASWVGQHFTQFLSSEWHADVDAAFSRTIAGESLSMRCGVPSTDGRSQLLWDIHLSPVRLATGVCSVLGIAHDVTEYVREKQEADASRDRRHVGKQRQAFLGTHPRFLHVVKLLDSVAEEETPVLLLGETGTGKEVAAAYLHQRSGRARKMMVPINCAGLPETLIESELFGYAAGAFTGAQGDKPGLFELANGGTLFLDEIGEMPLPMQAKLLRVLETGTFRRLGETKERRTNVRLIAATNRQLRAMVEEGKFRADLFFRLNVFPVTLPPLRERSSDIPLLARHFLHRHNEKRNEPVSLSQPAVERLMAHTWPGNIRELGHVLERAVLLSDTPVLTPGILELAGELPARRMRRVHQHDQRITKDRVVAALEEADNNRSEAARSLGLHRRQLYRLLKRFGID